MLRKGIGHVSVRRGVRVGAQFEWYREPMARLKQRRAILLYEISLPEQRQTCILN